MTDAPITTAVTKALRIRSPVLLAGMGPVSNATIAAAVTNAGGLGVLGAPAAPSAKEMPDALRREIRKLKELLVGDKTAFGVDLLLPQVGGNARKTNYDYYQGTQPQLVDVMCEEGCRLFVSAVGVPAKWVVDKLHASGCLVMNMVGHPKHVDKAIAAGVDLICAQGGEAGGHTGSIATMCLIPQCVDKCRGHKSPLTGEPIHVVGAGGIYDGRTVAAALSLGAEAVWVGTRFLCSEEAAATKIHKNGVVGAGAGDVIQSLHFSGRPCRMLNTPYVKEWNGTRSAERDELLKDGKVPLEVEYRNIARASRKGDQLKSPGGIQLTPTSTQPLFMGQVSGAITSIEPVATIMRELVGGAAKVLQSRAALVGSRL